MKITIIALFLTAVVFAQKAAPVSELNNTSNAFTISSLKQFPNLPDDSVDKGPIEKFFITPAIQYNLPGMGIKLNLGYNISNYFSLVLSTGYMSTHTPARISAQQRIWDSNTNDYIETIYSDGKKNHHYIPIELSLRYNFTVFGLQTYAFYSGGWYTYLDEGTYDVSIVTKYQSSGKIIDEKNGKGTDIYGMPQSFSDFGSALGVGFMVPLNNKLNLDLSYTFSSGTISRPVHSIGLGLNFGIK